MWKPEKEMIRKHGNNRMYPAQHKKDRKGENSAVPALAASVISGIRITFTVQISYYVLLSVVKFSIPSFKICGDSAIPER